MRPVRDEEGKKGELKLKHALMKKKLSLMTLKMKVLRQALSVLDALPAMSGMHVHSNAALKLRLACAKLEKKIMLAKIVHLTDLLFDCVHSGRQLAYGHSHVTAQWLQRHILHQIMLNPQVIPAFLALRLHSHSHAHLAPMLAMLKWKLMHAMRGMDSADKQATQFTVRADRAIVNLGHGNCTLAHLQTLRSAVGAARADARRADRRTLLCCLCAMCM
jgi:hypothetical protein